MKLLDIEMRRPLAPTVVMFVCAEVVLFALIGLSKLPMPGPSSINTDCVRKHSADVDVWIDPSRNSRIREYYRAVGMER